MSKRKNARLVLPNNGSKSIDILKEELANSEDGYLYLSITLNPEEQFYELSEMDRFIYWTDRLYKYLKEKTHYCSIEVYPEVSPVGRLHVHGVVAIEDKYRYLFQMYDVPALVRYGHIEIDTIGDWDVWKTYFKKQVKYLKPLTETNKYYDNDGCMRVNPHY